jgi:hypothetical protein
MGPRFPSFRHFWFLSVFGGFCLFLGFRNQWKLKCRITDATRHWHIPIWFPLLFFLLLADLGFEIRSVSSSASYTPKLFIP